MFEINFIQLFGTSLDPQAGMSTLEEEIDHAQRVAPRQLSPTGMIYGLTEDEIKIMGQR